MNRLKKSLSQYMELISASTYHAHQGFQLNEFLFKNKTKWNLVFLTANSRLIVYFP